MKNNFIFFIFFTAILLSINPSSATITEVNYNNRSCLILNDENNLFENLAYDQTYQIKHAIKKLQMEINKSYREIQKIKKSNSLSNNEKEIKIRKLKRNINIKEKEIQKLRQKGKRIIS